MSFTKTYVTLSRKLVRFMDFDLSEFVQERRDAINFASSTFSAKKGLLNEHIDPTLPEADIFKSYYISSVSPAIYLWIHYKDKNGSESKRTVRAFKTTHHNHDIYIHACTLNNDKIIIFAASRILKLVNPKTGEEIENPLDYFIHHPIVGIGKFVNNANETRVISYLKDEIYILSLMASIDKEFHQLEYEYIVKFVNNHIGRDLDKTQLIKNICFQEPNEIAIKKALNNIILKPYQPYELVISLKEVMAADGIHHPNEIAFCKYILDILGKNFSN